MSDPSPGRTLPLRRWLAIGFVAIILSFVIPFIVTFGIIYHSGGAEYGEGLQWAKNRVDNDFAQWTDPTWQSEIADSLAHRDVDGFFRVNGIEVFRTTDDPFADSGNDGEQVIRVTASENGVDYQADLYAKAQVGPPPALAYILPVAIALVVTTITVVALFLRRTVVDPLAATSAAARRVAVGELDVELPGSRVREVAEVNGAFSGMSAALSASLEQQAKLEEERRLFIGAIAHDLRTPLFSLRGSLEGLATGIANTPEKRDRYLSVAREKADNLERLISDLFDFTRLEYLEQTPHRELLDLNEVVQHTGDGMVDRAEAREIRLLFAPAPGSLPIEADLHMLTRSIENVLDNALRHTPAGGNITLRTGKREGQTWFSITDTGPGIAPADLPHIFTPLYRSETSRNRRTGGAGLGLAIARNMLRAHGGDLTAGNSEQDGAVFEGTLPT